MSTSQEGLGQAIYDALCAGSMGKPGDLSVLLNPRMFYSFVTDSIGARFPREGTVLERACSTERYTRFFYDAGMHGAAHHLLTASKEGATYLASQFAVDRVVARSLSDAMAEGVALFLGINDFELERQPDIDVVGDVKHARDAGEARTSIIPNDSQAITMTHVMSDESSFANVTTQISSKTPVMGQTVNSTADLQSETQNQTQVVNEDPVPVNPFNEEKKPRNYTLIITVACTLAAVIVAAGFFVWRHFDESARGSHGEQSASVDTPQGGTKKQNTGEQKLTSGETKQVANTTKATITFDGNGADEGSTPAPMTCDAWSEVILPTPGDMGRKGFRFAGWGESKTAKTAYPANQVYYVEGDTTLYAVWNVVIEDSDQFEIKDVAYAADDGGYVAMAFVTNNSESTVDIRADFEFLDESGKVLDSSSDSAISVGPGDTTMLTKQTDKKNVTSAKWSMTATAPVYGATSASKYLTASIAREGDDGVDVKVENTGDEPAWLMFCTLYGHDEQNRYAQQTNLVEEDKQKIEPGKSIVLTYDGDYWKYLDKDIYLYGFADKYE